MNQFRSTLRIVSLNDKGLPDIGKGAPSLGDMYLAPSLTEPDMYDQWIWAGDSLEWQRLGSIPNIDEEKSLREQRVNNVKQYFKEHSLKRQRRDELLSIVERGEHLSREEQRELSAMGYTI